MIKTKKIVKHKNIAAFNEILDNYPHYKKKLEENTQEEKNLTECAIELANVTMNSIIQSLSTLYPTNLNLLDSSNKPEEVKKKIRLEPTYASVVKYRYRDKVNKYNKASLPAVSGKFSSEDSKRKAAFKIIDNLFESIKASKEYKYNSYNKNYKYNKNKNKNNMRANYFSSNRSKDKHNAIESKYSKANQQGNMHYKYNYMDRPKQSNPKTMPYKHTNRNVRTYITTPLSNTKLYLVKSKSYNIENTFLGNIPYFDTKDNNYLYGNVNLKYLQVNKLNVISLVKEFNIHWHNLFKNSILERFISFCVKHGKKYKAETIIFRTLHWIKLYYHKKPLHTMYKGILNVMPFMEVKSFRMGKEVKWLPKHIHARRRVLLACRWITRYSKPGKKNKSKLSQQPFYKKLALELLASSRKKSRSFIRKVKLHKFVYKNRVNSNLSKKFLNKKRNKKSRFIKIRKRREYYKKKKMRY